jgi:copper(I)-binding protein
MATREGIMIIANNNVRGLLLALVLALGALVLAGAATLATAGENIVIKQAWSRATPKGAQVAGAYLTIENHGTAADRLISAATPAVAKVEIHEMTTLNGIMMMRPVDGGLVIPPGAGVTFAPGGDHLMFIGLGAPLSEGEHIRVALMFEKAGMIDVTFDVGSIGAKGPRMIIASTEAVVPAPSAPPPGDFFTHLCGTRVMANVTVSPRRDGPIDVLVALEDANEQPLAAEGLSASCPIPSGGLLR